MDNTTEKRIAVLEMRMNEHQHQALDSTTPLWQTCFVSYTIPGILAQTAGNFGVFFVAPFPCFVIGIAEVHTVANGGAATLEVERLTGTQAPGAGTVLMTSSFNLNATANTPQYAGVRGGSKLIARTGLEQGDRLSLKETGALVALADTCVTIQLQY